MAKPIATPQAKKTPLQAEDIPVAEKLMSAETLPAENRDQPISPTIQTNLLSGLLEEDLMSALLSTDPLSALAAGQGPLQYKTKGDLDKLLKSPWLWVGLAGAGLLALVLVLDIA